MMGPRAARQRPVAAVAGLLAMALATIALVAPDAQAAPTAARWSGAFSVRAVELGDADDPMGLISDAATLQFVLTTNPNGTFRADVAMTEETFTYDAGGGDTCTWTLASPVTWADENVFIAEIDNHLWLDPNDTFGIPGSITWNEDCSYGSHSVHTQGGYDFGWPLYACPVKTDASFGTYEADAGPVVKSSPTNGTVHATTSRTCSREHSSLTQSVTSNLVGQFPAPPVTPTPSPTAPPTPSPTPSPTATASAPVPPPTTLAFPSTMKVKGELSPGSTIKLKNYAVVARRLAVTYKFQWYAGRAKIKAATTSRLLLTKNLVGARVAVKVKAIRAGQVLVKKVVAGKVREHG